jgi:hypothetical protein
MEMKDDVVDAQHDLEQGQGGERDPGGGSAIHSSMIEPWLNFD